jgi:hypothetical protein
MFLASIYGILYTVPLINCLYLNVNRFIINYHCRTDRSRKKSSGSGTPGTSLVLVLSFHFFLLSEDVFIRNFTRFFSYRYISINRCDPDPFL